MIAAKHFDIVLGVDIHIVMVPTPGGLVPVPIPHPFIGMMFDPNDYDIAGAVMGGLESMGVDLQPMMDLKANISSGLDKFNPAKRITDAIQEAQNFAKNQLGISPPPGGAATVKVNGLPRSIITSKGIATPPHFPIGGPTFQRKPGNDCEAFLGSMTVNANREHLCFLGCMAESCQDIPHFPNSVILAIPGGPPVMVGGPPVPSLNQLALKAFSKAMRAVKNSKFVKRVSKRIHNAAHKGMNKLGIPPKSFVRELVHDQICDVTGHPVVISTGKVYTRQVDLVLPGPMPLVWARKWKSTSEYRGLLGHGWHWEYDLAIAIMQDAIVVRMADGRPVIFPYLLKGESFVNTHEKMTLFRNEEGYFMRDEAETDYVFQEVSAIHFEEEKVLPLAAVKNSAGHQIGFLYDEEGNLEKIIDSSHRELPIKTDSFGRIIRVEGPHPDFPNRTITLITYKYDKDGNCTTVRDALEQPFRYAYQGHLLVKETNRNGLNFYFEYDQPNSEGRCIRTWGDGGIYDHRLQYNLEEKWTKVIDSLGNTSQYFWDDKGRTRRRIDAKGNSFFQTYDDHSNLTREIDAIGQTTTHLYDGEGNKVQSYFPDGSEIAMAYQKGLLVSAIDQIGGAWAWKYDEQRRLTTRTDCEGQQTTYAYEGQHLSTITNASGSETQVHYNEQGLLGSITLQDGTSYHRSYDALGRLREIRDPRGNTRILSYDSLGRVVTVEEPDGNKRQFAYDGEGNVILAKDKHHHVRFTYTQMNRLKARVENGTTVTFSYDTEGNLRGIENEHGFVYQFTLDENHQVRTESGFDGITRVFNRDPLGRVKEIERPDGSFTAYGYDPMGRVLEVLYSNGATESYKYRPDGQLIEATNNHIRVAFERDGLGQILKEIQAGFEISSEYNAVGLRTSYRSSQGAEVKIERNIMGDVLGIHASESDQEWQASFERDEFGLEIERILPGNVRSSWERDRMGRPLTHQVGAGNGPDLHREYSWDVNNRITGIRDSRWGTSTFEHDAVGNLAAATYGDGSQELRMPDAVGNLFKTRDRSDRKYGPAGQLLKADGARFEYDREGNLTRKIEKNGGIWLYNWHVSGMLKSVRRPDGELVSFTYDALGRRIAKKFRNTLTRWVWDRNVMLHEWKEPVSGEGLKASNDIDDGLISISEVTHTVNSGQESDIFFPDEPQAPRPQSQHVVKPSVDTGLSTWVFEPGRFSPLARLSPAGTHSVVTDHLGTPIAMYDETGAEVWGMELSIYGEVKSQHGDPELCRFRYPGQYEDAETGLYYNRFRYYDKNIGLFLRQDLIGLEGGFNLYSYPPDPLIRFDPLGLVECGPDVEIFEGTSRSWEKGATPNSIYVQKTPDGRVKSISYYDENGVRFSREDYIQNARHKVDFDGQVFDLKNHPHEHQTRTLEGPNGPYKKKQVRILDNNGFPTTGWKNEK